MKLADLQEARYQDSPFLQWTLEAIHEITHGLWPADKPKCSDEATDELVPADRYYESTLQEFIKAFGEPAYLDEEQNQWDLENDIHVELFRWGEKEDNLPNMGICVTQGE